MRFVTSLVVRGFLKPSLAPIFRQLLYSEREDSIPWCPCGLIVGADGILGADWANVACDFGGVVGGVIGSTAESGGDGESVLSSVRSVASAFDEAPETVVCVMLEELLRPNTADRRGCAVRVGERAWRERLCVGLRRRVGLTGEKARLSRELVMPSMGTASSDAQGMT